MSVGRRVKIVATLGPATDPPDMLEALLRAGVDVVRLNFSHGTHEQHAERVQRVRATAETLGRPIAIMQDLQGPKIRTGRLRGGRTVELRRGAELCITTDPIVGTAERVSTTYQGLPGDCRPGDTLLLNDGRIRLTVLDRGEHEVRARVDDGGPLGEHKGINLPGVTVSAAALTEKDKQDLVFGIQLGVDFVALSFVRDPNDLHVTRAFIAQHSTPLPLIAKLEKPQAVERLDAILASSDAVMVARGDLGVELAPEEVPPLQKTIIRRANQRGIPVITATQMLESMVVEPTPTRAEASDVANSVWDGTDAVMLSAETAAGAFPLQAVEMMHRVVVRAEAAGERSPIDEQRRERGRMTHAHAISHAARALGEALDVSAVAAFTRTGRTAELLSQDRPRFPIYAFTPDERTYRRLALWWGVAPLFRHLTSSSEMLIEEMERILLDRQRVQNGSLIVVLGSLPFRPGVHTNFVKLHTVHAGR